MPRLALGMRIEDATVMLRSSGSEALQSLAQIAMVSERAHPNVQQKISLTLRKTNIRLASTCLEEIQDFLVEIARTVQKKDQINCSLHITNLHLQVRDDGFETRTLLLLHENARQRQPSM